MTLHKYKIAIALILCLELLFGPLPLHAASGGVDTLQKFAWSENFGWINFGASEGNVQVSDTGMSGYAWNENTGWINLHPSSVTYVHNNGQGTLSGYAWGEGTGYIDFSGVTVDSHGVFHGYALAESGGRISMNCDNSSSCSSSNFKVQTYWQPGGTIAAPSGGGGILMSTKPLPSVFASLAYKISDPNIQATSTVNCTMITPFFPLLTKDLKKNYQDAEVVSLQKFLNSNGFPVTNSGPGSYGKESLLFGSLTYQALAKFQRDYASKNSDSGIMSEIGTVGSKTRDVINAMRDTEKLSANVMRMVCVQVLCPTYLHQYISYQGANSPAEVTKLQDFLRTYEGFTDVESTGTYNKDTFDAVVKFQQKYLTDILIPWQTAKPTGFVYKTTKQKINDLYCFYSTGLVR